MFFSITAAGAQKYPSGLTSGKPPFSFRGPSGTAGLLKEYFLAKLVCLKKEGKVIPSSAAKYPKKGKEKLPPRFP